MLKRYGQFMIALLMLSDAFVAAVAWYGAYHMRHLAGVLGLQATGPQSFAAYLPSLALCLILTPMLYSRFGLYEPKRTKSLLQEYASVARAVVLAWALAYIIVSFMGNVKLSRLVVGSALLVWLALATFNRLVARSMLRRVRRKGWNLRWAAIVGTGRLAQKLYYALKHNSWTGVQLRYFVGDPTVRSELLGLDVLGPQDAVDEIVVREPVDIVFVALPGNHHDEITQVLDRLAVSNVDVRVVPDLLAFHFLRHDVTQLDNIPIITMTYSPQHGWNSLLKRAFDLVVSAAAVLVLAVPMVLIALAIKLTSRGPVFYRQVRTSLGGVSFRIIKFRTMDQNAEVGTGPVWAAPDDARVTPVGRFLRRTSLDEVSQLFNVLAGHMSLVGPRPERPELIEQFRHQVPRYMLRQQVKAGLTGWAQVHGLRGMTSLRKRVQYDLYYITNWTFGLDFWILLMTPLRGLVNRNAY